MYQYVELLTFGILSIFVNFFSFHPLFDIFVWFCELLYQIFMFLHYIYFVNFYIRSHCKFFVRTLLPESVLRATLGAEHCTCALYIIFARHSSLCSCSDTPGSEYLKKAGQAKILYQINHVTPKRTTLFLRKCLSKHLVGHLLHKIIYLLSN